MTRRQEAASNCDPAAFCGYVLQVSSPSDGPLMGHSSAARKRRSMMKAGMQSCLLVDVTALFCAFLLLASTEARSCTSDLDCQLNGVCSAKGACQCDAAWSAPDCGQLRLYPGTIAYHPPNTTAWGGGPPVFDNATGQWVLFVTEIANHCGLSEWFVCAITA